MALVRVKVKIQNKEGNVKFCKSASFCQSAPSLLLTKKKKSFFSIKILKNTQYSKYLNSIKKLHLPPLMYTYIVPSESGFLRWREEQIPKAVSLRL